MKDTPILFSAPMVRAILDGRKTQTRRIIKNPDYYGCPTGDCPHIFQEECDKSMAEVCPYGHAAGDRLWVKETYRVHKHFDRLRPKLVEVAMGGDTAGCINFVATPIESSGNFWGKTRVAIHMPRAFSRIHLELTAAPRHERLQDISEADAIAEGIEPFLFTSAGRFEPPVWRDYSLASPDDQFEGFSDPVHSYRTLWDSINDTEASSWMANPWVWVLSFRRL